MDKEQIDYARKKNPVLFKIFDERSSFKFKSPSWLKQQAIKKQNLSGAGGGNKGNHHIFKNLKQILINFDPDGTDRLIQNPEGTQYSQQLGSYMSIDSGISVKIAPRYCDFSGFHAKYKHRINGLRYTEETHYGQIEKMQNSKLEEYLSCRKAVVLFK